MRRENILIIISLFIIYGFYLYVGYLAANPHVTSAYRMFYLEKKLRNWNSGSNAAYQLGDLIDFSKELSYLSRDGWSTHEPTGTWSNGKSSEIFLKIGKSKTPIEILFSGTPFLFPPAGLTSQLILLFINGKYVGSCTLSKADEVLFNIPPETYADFKNDGLLIIRFEFPNAESPRNLGEFSDTRTLGILFSKMIVR